MIFCQISTLECVVITFKGTKRFHFVSKTVVTNCQRHTVLHNRGWNDCVMPFEDISGILFKK